MNTCKTAFYHLRNIAKRRNCLSQDNSETLVHAFIHVSWISVMFWKSLTDDIISIQNLDVFKNKIKTLLFREAFIS